MINPRLEALAKYMAEADPRSVNKLGYKWGYLPAESAEGREGMIYRGIIDEGEAFLKDVAMFHPDREMILAANGEQNYVGETGIVPKQYTYQEMAQGLDKPNFVGEVKQMGADPKFMLTLVMFLVIAFLTYQLIAA